MKIAISDTDMTTTVTKLASQGVKAIFLSTPPGATAAPAAGPSPAPASSPAPPAETAT